MRISIENETSIVAVAEKGYSLRKIAEKVGVRHRAVHSTIKQNKQKMQSKPKNPKSRPRSLMVFSFLQRKCHPPTRCIKKNC